LFSDGTVTPLKTDTEDADKNQKTSFAMWPVVATSGGLVLLTVIVAVVIVKSTCTSCYISIYILHWFWWSHEVLSNRNVILLINGSKSRYTSY